MTDRTTIDAEYEAIKAESVEKVRKALKVITSYSRLCDASGNITEAGRNALGEVEGLDLFWIVDPMIKLAKHRPTEEITEEQAIDVLHHHGWLVVRSEHKAVETPKSECETCGCRIFTYKLTDNLVDVMVKHGITSVEEFMQKLKGGGE